MSHLPLPPRLLITIVVVTQWMTIYITMMNSRNFLRSGEGRIGQRLRASSVLSVVTLLRNKPTYLHHLPDDRLSPLLMLSRTHRLGSFPTQTVCLHLSSRHPRRHFPRRMRKQGQVHAQQAFSTHSLPKPKPKPFLPPRNIPRPMQPSIPGYLPIIN